MDGTRLKYYADKIELILVCLVAFLVPVCVKFSSYVIAVLFLLFLFRKQNYLRLRNSLKNVYFWALIFPFLLYLVGLAYSTDLALGLKHVETAMSLLVFPFLMLSFFANGTQGKGKYLYASFILGVLVIFVCCIVRAAFRFYQTSDIDVWFYGNLINAPHHVSYYVLFAIILLYNDLMTAKCGKQNGFFFLSEIVCIFLFSLFLMLLSSKITILLFITFCLVVLIKMLFSNKIPKYLSILVLISFLVMTVFAVSMPNVKKRFNKMFQTVEVFVSNDEQRKPIVESTSVRIYAVKSALKIISNNPLWGVGTGDVDLEMETEMKNIMGDNYASTCSPHNQFLRSFASFGILGVLSLIFMFALMFYVAIKKKNVLMIYWSVLTIVLFCVEDMLSIINGVVFFCLFTSYLLLKENR